MKARIVAWLGVMVLTVVCVVYGPKVSNPFNAVVAMQPLANALPKLPPGCREKGCP